MMFFTSFRALASTIPVSTVSNGAKPATIAECYNLLSRRKLTFKLGGRAWYCMSICIVQSNIATKFNIHG